MSKKTGSFFEAHIEKIVLAVIGLVCIWLLVTRVIFSPNSVEYDGKKFGAGNIDVYVSKRVEILENKINQKPEEKPPYKPRLDEYLALVDSTVNNVDANIILPQPNKIAEASSKKTYRIPAIGSVSDVKIEHIRAVAYVPTEKINEDNTYDVAEHEPKDIDFVTVEAKFDVAALCKSFFESFAGKDVREEWRDQYLATPVFAAVELERQQQLADGSWGDWQVVPRTQIDHYKKLFEIIEDVKKLPAGGLKVRLLRFRSPEIITELLQPRAYVIASAKEDWFPPSLHKEFIKYQQAVRLQEKREARTIEKETRERDRQQLLTERGSKLTETRTTNPSLSDESRGDATGLWGGTGSSATTTRKMPVMKSGSERPEKTKEAAKPTFDIFSELKKVTIGDKTDFTKMLEPLVLWAHDDAVEPGKIYRYRMRVGVFNPIAGTNQFYKQDEAIKNKVVLWSEFSDTTESVAIPGVQYFFPVEIQEAAKTVTIEVATYALGYWYAKDFMVRIGEAIGKEMGSEANNNVSGIIVPQTINYSTGAVLVDVVPVNDWFRGRTLTGRRYFDMLYTYDGVNIDRMPIRQKYWPEELQAKFGEIKRSVKEPKEPIRDWEAGSGQQKQFIRGLEGGVDG